MTYRKGQLKYIHKSQGGAYVDGVWCGFPQIQVGAIRG